MNRQKLFLVSLSILIFTCADSLSMINCPFAPNQQDKEIYASPQNVETKIKELFERDLPYYTKEAVLHDNLHFWISGSQNHYTNIVTYSSFDDENEAEGAIAHVLEMAQQESLPITWWVMPRPKPANMTTLLQVQGFSFYDAFPVLICFLDEINQNAAHENIHPVIKKITEPEQVDAWAEVMGNSFGLDELLTTRYGTAITNNDLTGSSFEHYASFIENKPVSTGSLFINGDCAGIANITTHHSFRKQGIATQMVIFLLQRAKELGLKYAILISAPEAQGLYKRIGFRKVFDIEYWVMCEFRDPKEAD